MAGCPAERQRYGTAASQSLFPPPHYEFAAAAFAKGKAEPGDISPCEQGAVTTFWLRWKLWAGILDESG